ncbi:MAG: putative nucleotidyltransferase substrate binding domain-containing protein [Corynebacterium sp.]|uniref:putative nucleotidyltransferase substrate binding domain-containing protein n=1 Tax=Corynebacterium sp. TaxID=1720 RepID=UPI0026DB7F8D|nr:putative nucleotidyltransferase substrate binding domain-containing protein [Corynebacterium sp.]MDO4761837.1 putative nucleotidyltransferase substrate binding domain-containing protein [Corynebacterium sp.]
MCMLHASLVELASQAPLCQDAATVRGVLAESQDLMRNAIEHNESPQDLVIWFSRVVTDVLHSEGVKSLTSGAELVLTGAVGRGDALPSSPIKWLTVGDEGVDSSPLSALIAQVGLVPDETAFGVRARTRRQWIQAIHTADGPGLAVFADAGTWCLREVLKLDDPTVLLREALSHRPPRVQLDSGLPDYSVAVDIRRGLLYPVIALARWAGVAARSTEFSTRARLEAAASKQVLTRAQADYLATAWNAGLSLQLRRFADRVHRHSTTASALPAIQRSIYGASARMVSDVAYSLAAANDISLDV